eukprot:GEMP01039183.1.p1 GENE.GEMP01039183.1~~GEMP01039183.1.p1  ORF type:complete len:609 (+),score=114.79 GEMP01039183.1:54-1880(+)
MWGIFNHQDSGTVPRGRKAVPEYYRKYEDGWGSLTPRRESRTGPMTPRQGLDAVPGIRGFAGERMSIHAPSAAKDSVRFYSSTRSLGPSGVSAARTESRAPYEWVETPRRAASTDSVRRAAERTFSSTPGTRDMFRFEAEAKPQKHKAEFSKGEGLTKITNSLSHTHRFDGVGAYGPGTREGSSTQRFADPLAWMPASPNPRLGKARVCKINLYKSPDDTNAHWVLNKRPVRREPETPRALRPPPSPGSSAPPCTNCNVPAVVHMEPSNGAYHRLRDAEPAILVTGALCRANGTTPSHNAPTHANGTATSHGAPMYANGAAASTPRTTPSHDKSIPTTRSSIRPVLPKYSGACSTSTSITPACDTASDASRDAGRAVIRARSEDLRAVEQKRAVELQHLRQNWQNEFRPEKRPYLNAVDVVCLSSPRRMPCRKVVPGYHVSQLTNVATDPIDDFRPNSRKVVPGQHVSQVSGENHVVERSPSVSLDRQPLNAIPGLRPRADDLSLPITPRPQHAPRVCTRNFEPPTESVLKRSTNPLDSAIFRVEQIRTRTTTVQPQPSASYVDMLARRDCGLNFSKDNQFRVTSTRSNENPRCLWTNARRNMRHSIH